MTSPTEIPPPLDRYEFERFQRKDALGETWRALDCKSGERVDLRALPAWADKAEIEGFVQLLVEIKHPNLISTRGLVMDGQRAAVVLESCDGETILQRRVRRPRRHFEISEIKPWLRSMVEVLAHLHQLDIPHGALNGGSFLIEGTDLKLTDLAISRLLRPQAKFDGASVLPLAVMSPQVMKGEPPTKEDDIYALGSLVYDLLTGASVFSSGDIATQVASAVPPSIQQRRAQLEIQSAPIAQAWEDWLAATLSKDPERRPSLDELAELLQSGSFRAAKTSKQAPTRASAVPVSADVDAAATAPEKSPRSSPLARVSLNHVVIGCSVLTLLLVSLAVYFLKIAPRNDFKREITLAFTAVQNFDAENTTAHDTVMSKWDAFLKEWQTRVTIDYPDFQPILSAAKEQRQTRQEEKERQEELARAEAAEARKLYITKIHAQYLTAQAKAASLASTPDKSAEVWTDFLRESDVPYEGAKLPELAKDIAEATNSLNTLLNSIAEEKKILTEERQKADSELARLRQLLADNNVGSGYKIGLVESYLTQMRAVPPVAQIDPQILEMRKAAELFLPPLQLQAEAETPKEPLDIKGLFVDSPCKDFSDNGRKHILKEAQGALKAQNFYTGEVDGGTGKMSHEAIVAFQKSKNLVPTAALDAPTLAALGLLELKDDAAPIPGQNTERRTSSRKKAQPEEEKGFFKKVGDGASNVGKSIGGFFGGNSDEKKKK